MASFYTVFLLAVFLLNFLLQLIGDPWDHKVVRSRVSRYNDECHVNNFEQALDCFTGPYVLRLLE